MSEADLLLLWVRSGAVLVVAGAAMLLARRNPALRVAAARWGLVGALLAALTVVPLGERPRPVVSVPFALPAISVPPLGQSAPLPKPTRATPWVAPARLETAPLEVRSFVLPLWGAGTLLLLAQLGLGVLTLRRARRSCRPVSSALAQTVARLATEASIVPPEALEGERITGPCVAGVRRAAIMLPIGWADRAEPEVVEAVLRHELAHIANGDLRWGLFARVTRIVLWPQPMVWLLRRSAATAEEEACDRQVLAAGVSQARYAAGLLALRETRATRVPGLAIGAVSGRSGFGRRIEAILAFRSNGCVRLSSQVGMGVRIGALVFALGATYVFARPGGRQTDPMAGWIKGPQAGPIRLVSGDGKPVQSARAWLVVSGDSPTPKVTRQGIEGNIVHLSSSPVEKDSSGVLAIRAPGFGLTFVRLWPAPKTITEIRPFPAVSLQGRAVRPDGGSVAGLPVEVTLLVRSGNGPGATFLQTKSIPELMTAAVTDANGGFRFDGLPPETRLQIEVDDDRFAKGGLDDRIETGKAAESSAIALKLRLAGRITGRVMRNGQPVVGVKIAAQTNTDKGSYDLGDWGEAVSGPDGRYAIERLGATIYNVATDLRNGPENEFTAPAHEAVAVTAGKTVEKIDFNLTPGSVIEGVASLPDGKPLAGTMVGVYGPAHPESSAWVQNTKTDDKGRYRLHVPAGAQRVYLMDQRYRMAHKRVTTSDGATLRLDLPMTGYKEEEAALAAPSTVASAPVEKLVEDAPTGPTASFGPGKPFYGPVRLSNGATVRLAFVQDGTTGNPIWSPDGGPATEPDRARAIDMEGFGGGKASRSLYLRVDVEGFDRRDYSAIAQPAHPSSWSPWQTYGDRHGASMDLASFKANRNLKVTDMRFGLAAGPRRTEYVSRLGEGPLRPEIALDEQTPPGTAVAIAIHVPAALVRKELRLEAITKDGRHLPLTFWEEKQPTARTFGFSDGTAADIDHVELQSRDYAWATFRGIRLYPKG